MSSLPPSRPTWRVPRAHLAETPAVLRFPDGQRMGANLQIVSLTGGLLSLSQPVVQGSQVKVMFLTGTGSVLGAAEMLSPVDDTRQPFRFVSIAADDHRRLGTLILERSTPSQFEEDWINKLRAASALQKQPRTWRRKLAGAIGLLTVGLAAAAYLLHFGSPK